MGTAAISEAVVAAGEGAREAAPSLAEATPAAIAAALTGIAANVRDRRDAIQAANDEDLEAARGVLAEAMVDRLRLGPDRLEAIAAQIETLAAAPDLEPLAGSHALADGTVVEERRRPVGVIGANFEARPNVTVDIASQLAKSRNGGVLRTGGAALRSSEALLDLAIAPALEGAGLDPAAIQLVRTPEREAARELVRHPDLIPLVIIRGSGETTAALAREAAAHGVGALAHAEGGGVLYVHAAADADRALGLVAASLDRLGVCNRLNLLLVDRSRWDELRGPIVERLAELGIRASLAPHAHPRGHEWALDTDNEATVTLDVVGDVYEAARIANRETSGLAAGICTEDAGAAEAFLAAYSGTGAFWNVTTRLLDGFKLLAAPETGINVARVPGPRGPVTYRDLYLRQYVVRPPG